MDMHRSNSMPPKPPQLRHQNHPAIDHPAIDQSAIDQSTLGSTPSDKPCRVAAQFNHALQRMTPSGSPCIGTSSWASSLSLGG